MLGVGWLPNNNNQVGCPKEHPCLESKAPLS